MTRFVKFQNNLEMKPGIIEFQSFRNSNKEFIIKELVILDVTTNALFYFLFKPPFSFHSLNVEARRTNRWLSQYFHHITWREGFISYNNLEDIMHNFCYKFSHVYTTGMEKCNWIKMYTTAIVKNCMLQKDYPIYQEQTCINIRNEKHKGSNCALRKAYRLYYYLFNPVEQPIKCNDENDDKKEDEEETGNNNIAVVKYGESGDEDESERYKYGQPPTTFHEMWSRHRGGNNCNKEHGDFTTIPAVSYGTV